MSDRGRLLYDADCGFCRRAVERWRTRTGDRVEYMASDRPIDAVEFLDADGERYQGAEAVFRALGGWRVWAYGNIPGFAPIGEAIYRFVARNRSRLSTIDELLNGAVEKPPTYIRARSLFLALLG
ncbi:MAG: DCC1-like thiol-disulfide oxidoreductase family protein, partial [Planctomycetota bacterium]|nr:DCC1-like thiol-disulfide oxidoreductase family protein [Planctomycetota bacterium]